MQPLQLLTLDVCERLKSGDGAALGVFTGANLSVLSVAGGLSTTAMVKIQLTDVNDNAPVFLPREYNVSLRHNTPPNTPVVVVVATDRDTGRFGEVSYAIAAGNEAGAFRVDSRSGELFVARPDLLRGSALGPAGTGPAGVHRLNVTASDGGGLRSAVDAQVSLTVVASSDQRPPLFERPRYTYSVRENVPRHSAVGTVRASSGEPGESPFQIAGGRPACRVPAPARMQVRYCWG